MDISRTLSESYKIYLCGGAVILALAWSFLPARWGPRLLLLLTVLATANYARFGTKVFGERVSTYDLVHYYLNAKYFDELGYYDLYPACIVADVDNGGPHFGMPEQYMHQDADGHRMVPTQLGYQRGLEVKATAFTPERWASFTHDFLYLQREVKGLDQETWLEMLQDHGFNGTTVWTMLAKPFTLVPVEYIKTICQLDLVLMLIALGAVAWAWNPSTALWGWLFLMLTYSMRWPTLSWAFLRYDFLALLVIALALLRKNYPLIAGFLTGWSALLRLFPAVWAFGPVARRTQALRFGLGFLLALGVLQGGALLTLGVEPVRVHIANMQDHNESANLSSRRIGLALGLAYDGELLPQRLSSGMKAVIEEQKPLRFGLSALTLGLYAWALRNRRQEEAFAYGFLPFFLLTTASYYYYVARWTLWILHAGGLVMPERDEYRSRHAVGLAMLAGLELFCNWSESTYPGHRVFLIGHLAWGMMGYTAVMGAWLWVESYTLGRFRR